MIRVKKSWVCLTYHVITWGVFGEREEFEPVEGVGGEILKQQLVVRAISLALSSLDVNANYDEIPVQYYYI